MRADWSVTPERAELTLAMICISVLIYPSHRSFRRLARHSEDVYRKDQFLRHTHILYINRVSRKEEVFRNRFSEENMAIYRHSSWQNIRLWKQGWTVAINQMDGGIWWQRLNECKRHQSASDYCNCHQIPPRPLTGHADPLAPPHTHIRATSTARPCTPQVLFLEHPWTAADVHTHKHTHTLSTCPFTLAGNSSPFFSMWVKCPAHRSTRHAPFDCLI